MAGNREWRARPVATFLVKALILLVPVAAGTVAGLLVARAVPAPDGLGARVAWSLAVLGTSSLPMSWSRAPQMIRSRSSASRSSSSQIIRA